MIILPESEDTGAQVAVVAEVPGTDALLRP